MHSTLKWLIVIGLWCPLIGWSATESPAYCELDPTISNWDAWQNCAEQRVKVTGEIAQMPMQHPTGLHNRFDPASGEVSKYETYIIVQDSQLVLTSEQPIECVAGITVEGIVDIIDLGGSKGKSSYKNVWLAVDGYECQ